MNLPLEVQSGSSEELRAMILAEDCYAIYLDETGIPNINADPASPYFGYGGIVVVGRRHHLSLARDWIKFKTKAHDPVSGKIKAAKFDFEKNEGSLKKFFGKNFIRFYFAADKELTKLENAPIIPVLIDNILMRILPAAFDFNLKIVVVMEDSERDRKAVSEAKEVIESNNSWWKKVSFFVLNKGDGIQFLEIADFVVNAGGAQSRYLGGNLKMRSDSEKIPLKFKVVFGSNEKKSITGILGKRLD